MQLDVESLRALVAVLDLGGMTKAAEALGVSQSAVSWKVKRLEGRVGRELLIREGRSFRPTRAGRALLNDARTIIATHDEAVARLSSSELRGAITLGATEEVFADCMNAVFSRFNRVHTRITIDFHVDRAARLESMLGKGELDVAVLQVTQQDRKPDDTVLWNDELVWVAAPDWTYDVDDIPLVTFGRSGFYRPLAEAALAEAGIGHRVAFSGPSSASVLTAVEAGIGVALMSARSVTGNVISWPRAQSMPGLPNVLQVARASPGDPSAIADELIAELESELAQAVLA